MPDLVTAPLSILVVDDEEGIRKLLQHWLQRAGHAVACAECGSAAARALRSQHFDLVITDIVMPDGDGYELITEFRKARPATRILAISGGGKYLQSAECLKMARGLGAHAIVMKPFKWEQVEAAIQLALPAPPASAN